jgi:hypothetical protein
MSELETQSTVFHKRGKATDLFNGIWGCAGVFWSSEGILLFSGHESNCSEIKFDSTLMSQEVNIICWPDGLEAVLQTTPAKGFEMFAFRLDSNTRIFREAHAAAPHGRSPFGEDKAAKLWLSGSHTNMDLVPSSTAAPP